LRRHIGWPFFRSYRILENLAPFQAFPRYSTARKLLEFYGDLSGISPSVLRTRVPALLDREELSDRGHEPIACFSKGMVQRLALAQGVLTEPDLLVLGDPRRPGGPGSVKERVGREGRVHDQEPEVGSGPKRVESGFSPK
jgi:ABC-2 type transport system ATP-binding protein